MAVGGDRACHHGVVYRVEPLSPGRWEDFAVLCRAMGTNRACWCMWWREEGHQAGTRRERARSLVDTAVHPIGLLAYAGGEPVGWAAVSPRAEYPRLNHTRETAAVGACGTVWAVPCFFVLESHRHRGVARALLAAAVELAASAGASAVEGVPGDPDTRARSPSASYTGTTGLFARAGFVEVARRTPKGRVVMRRQLPPRR